MAGSGAGRTLVNAAGLDVFDRPDKVVARLLAEIDQLYADTDRYARIFYWTQHRLCDSTPSVPHRCRRQQLASIRGGT